jgi:hypothetical protein
MKKSFSSGNAILAVLLVIFLALTGTNCQVKEESSTDKVPVLNTISPDTSISHMPAFTLTVTGQDFVGSSKIVFNDEVQQTSYISETELTCVISPDRIVPSAAAAGTRSEGRRSAPTADSTVQIKVRNPDPGGDSNSMPFTIKGNYSFYTPQNISYSATDSFDYQIAVDASGAINMVWTEVFNYHYEIFFSRSTDNGATWTPAVNLSIGTALHSYSPKIILDNNGNINMVWESLIGETTNEINYEVLYSRSTDNGATWTAPLMITHNFTDSRFPDITVDASGVLYVLWTEEGSSSYDIYFTRSIDNGATWSQHLNLTGNYAFSSMPRIAVDSNGVLYSVWHSNDPFVNNGINYIVYTYSTTGGDSWTTPRVISNNVVHATVPDIALDTAGTIYLVWQEYDTSTSDIIFTSSGDYGNTWSQQISISAPSAFSVQPAIAIDTVGNLNVVWCDQITISGTNNDVHFARSINAGETWAPLLNLANNAGDSTSPRIKLDGYANVYIIWHDNTPNYTAKYFTTNSR